MRSMTLGAVAFVLGCLGVSLSAGCGEKVPSVPAGDSSAGNPAGAGKGTLLVTGTGKETYGLYDGKGVFQTSVTTNEEKELLAGAYTLHLGNRVEAAVKGGERTTIAAGTLLVTGTGSYQLYDGKGVFQTSLQANEEKELMAGAYTVKVDEKDHAVVVVASGKARLER